MAMVTTEWLCKQTAALGEGWGGQESIQARAIAAGQWWLGSSCPGQGTRWEKERCGQQGDRVAERGNRAVKLDWLGKGKAMGDGMDSLDLTSHERVATTGGCWVKGVVE
jgi:hypothetical protein